MIGKITAALTELGKLKSSLPSKIQDNKAFIDKLKLTLTNIDGRLFVPTGLDNLTGEQLLAILEESYPGFVDDNKLIIDNTPVDNIIETGDYTEEEILSVLSEWSNTDEDDVQDNKIIESIDCDPYEEPIFIPYTQRDIIEAMKCNDVQPLLDVRQIDVIDDANVTPDELLGDEMDVNIDYNLDDIELLSKSIEEPSNIIIVSTIPATLTNIKCSVGQSVNCSTVLFNTNKGDILAGVENGTIISININVGDNINNKELVEIKSHGKSNTSKILSNTIKRGKKINKLIKLKEQEPEIENNYFLSKIQEAFYEGRYEAYSMYFNSFNPLVELRSKRNADLQSYYNKLSEAEDIINDYFKDGNIQYATGDGKTIMDSSRIKSEVKQIIDNRNKYVLLIQDAIKDINEATSKINQIRDGKNFFATTSDEALAAIDNNTIDIDSMSVDINGNQGINGRHYYKNPILDKTIVTPFSPSTKLIGVPAPHTLAKSLQGQIDHFTNELGVNKLTYDKITDKTVESYQPSFKRLEVKEADSGDKAVRWTKAKVKGSRNSKGLLIGKYHELNVDFFNFVYYSSDKDKTSSWWVSEVKSRELQLRTDVSIALADVIKRVHAIGMQYGEVAIANNRAFIENRGSNALLLFKQDLDAIRNTVKLAKDKLDEIREGLDDTQNSDNLMQDINSIMDSNCTYYNSFSTDIRDGKKYKLFGWPSTAPLHDSELSSTNINYRGNPVDPDISPGITDIKWWQRFCELASTVNLIPTYWPVGLLLPTPVSLIKIPLPVTWIPIAVIPTPTVLIISGIAQAGVLPCPFVTVLNLSDAPVGPVPGNSIYLAGAVRPFKKIKSNPGSAILPIAPIINIGSNTIDTAPHITQQVPLIKDDLPPWERLSLDNPLFLLFLADWCKAGKKGEGFFENP